MDSGDAREPWMILKAPPITLKRKMVNSLRRTEASWNPQLCSLVRDRRRVRRRVNVPEWRFEFIKRRRIEFALATQIWVVEFLDQDNRDAPRHRTDMRLDVAKFGRRT